MKILFLSTLLPYPLDNGGKIKTYNLLKVLSNKHEVDFVSFINNSKEKKYVKELEKFCRTVNVKLKTLVMRDSKKEFAKAFIKSIFTNHPYVVYKFWSKEMHDFIREIQLKNKYDIIFVDHLQMMIYSRTFKSKVILDEHNVESTIMYRYSKSESNLIKKIIGFIEYKKLYRFEKKSLENAGRVIALSEQDKEQLRKINKNSDISVIPICIDEDFKKTTYNNSFKKNKLNLLFLGTMSWYPNYQGISWFVKNVFSKLDPTKFNLYIVGGNPPEEILELKKYENINVTGYVNNVNEYIELCDINIVPLFVGSGLRVKIIEAFAKGIPTLSTEIGAEGLEANANSNILIANTAEEFEYYLLKIIEEPEFLEEIVKNGFKTYEKYYSLNSLEKKINNLINSNNR